MKAKSSNEKTRRGDVLRDAERGKMAGTTKDGTGSAANGRRPLTATPAYTGGHG